MNINELLAQKDKLPNVPEVVKELIQVLSDDNANLDAIANKVAKDPTLSVKILRMVNSSYYGLPRTVNSIDEAIVRIGFERLKILVISSGLSGSVTGEVEGLDIKRFWNESFETGEICKIIAKKTRSVEADVAFTAGIISNIGRLLLHLTTPNRAKAVQTMVDEGADRNQAELDRFQFTSPEAGAALLEQWKLPVELCVAVLQQRAPLNHAEPSPLAAVISMAKQMLAARKRGDSAKQIVDAVSLPLVSLAGVKEGLGDIAEQVVNLEPMKIA
ncbi:MAG: HDOD domain-containing protein [Halopseudomonas sp.]|uniref:HDOD domain-containing protein n=1 Tax=Halopseudomonas sp. TaxID=2901191 RepID=UPI003001124C